MATKKITELTNVTSVQDTDLLIIETSDGTRSISKSNLVSEIDSEIKEKQNKIKTSSITLSASNWNGNDDTFTQVVSIAEGTTNSKIDLQPDSVVLNQLINDDVSALYIENNNSTFTAYAIGAIPTVDLTIQVTVTEVE